MGFKSLNQIEYFYSGFVMIKINFFKYRFIAFVFSTILFPVLSFLFAKDNLNLGIDFKGGILIEANFNEIPDLSSIREKLVMMEVVMLRYKNLVHPTIY